MTIQALVVDDDDDLREALCEALVDEGYEASGAADGEQALAMIRRRAPDVILLDLMMPNMNGWEFCAELGRDPELSKIPVIVMTAASNVPRRDDLMSAAHLRKPFALSDLFVTLNRLVRTG
jgi:CheY-like chemotaxis protein